MSVLVTGASGFLGSHMVDLLIEDGVTVKALARPGEDVSRLDEQGVEICWGDLKDRVSLRRAAQGVEHVFHCAARTGPWGPVAEYEAANVLGVRALVEEALASGVRRFVHVSSITVHGNDVHGVACEDTPRRTEPNPYSRTKLAGELVLEEMIASCHAPVTIVRPGWIYGPRDAASFGRFASMIEQGKMVVIGSGGNRVPLIYVTDVARGMLLAANSPAAVGRAYLLVSDEGITQSDYLGAIAAELGVAPPARHVPYRLALALGATAERMGRITRRTQPPPLMRYGLQLAGGENAFDITRARRELGFEPQVNLAAGVRRSVAWYKAAYHATNVRR